MTKDERMKEIAKASPDFGKRVGYKMCVIDEFHDMKELLEENAELKAGKDINVFTKQLTKAKELIRQLCSMVRELNKPNVQLTNVDYSLSEAEQFLKETVVDS